MSVWAIILPSLGGIIAALAILRAIFRNVDATQANTKAIEKLNDALPDIGVRLTNLEKWQAIMEDRRNRRL